MSLTSISIQDRLSVINAAFEQEKKVGVADQNCVDVFKNGRRKSVQFTARPTIVFDSAFKSFGKDAILRNINITVKDSTVYGIYGKSGSGKTTALRCLLGIKSLDSGTIYARGFVTGRKGSGVPGKRIGYMPQELALDESFSIRETLHYYGKLYGMNYDLVESQLKYFVTLFHLESCRGQIFKFKSTEKQIVSFIVALFHQPGILVMDEPTLKMDPLCREIFWQHLRDLVAESKTTVLMASVSAYELSMVDTIGILRGGKLLMEAPPSVLLSTFDSVTIDTAILKLYKENDKEKSSQTRWNSIGVKNKRKNDAVNNSSKPTSVLLRQASWNVGKRDFTTILNKVQALALKNIFLAYRNVWLLLLFSILPAITIAFLSLSLTFTPHDLKFGLVTNDSVESFSFLSYDNVLSLDGCQILSCEFFKRLQREGLNLIPFTSEDAARKGVSSGSIFGYLSLLEDKLEETKIAQNNFENVTRNSGLVKVILDTTNPFMSSWLKTVILSNFHAIVFDNTLNDQLTLQNGLVLFESATFDGEKYTYASFVVPGVAIRVITTFASIISAILFLHEKSNGKYERIAAIGVNHCDILFAHLSFMTFLLLIQLIMSYFTIFYFFQIQTVGSVPLAFCLTLVDGFSGLAFGALVAAVVTKAEVAVLILFALTLPAFFVSGTIVPLEGLPSILQYVGYFYPGTLPGIGLKSILLKGWGLREFGVFIGFGSSFAYTVAYILLNCLYHHVIQK